MFINCFLGYLKTLFQLQKIYETGVTYLKYCPIISPGKNE
jgi:hypothetical protein